jgi:hypothetical protein
VRTADGQGRVACCEILVMTGRVHDMILDPKLTGQLPEVVAEGAYYGMQTFDQHLLQHLQAGRITFADAMRVATSPHDFKLMVAAESKPSVNGGQPATPAREQAAAPAAAPGDGIETGPTRRAPLGTVAGARSGDKGGDANVGFWARSDAGYRWLRAYLTEDRLRQLLPEARALPVARYELPNLRALNFVISGLLGEGVAASTRFDPQAKALGELLRARIVDIPESLL